jgi:hypothetical protein
MSPPHHITAGYTPAAAAAGDVAKPERAGGELRSVTFDATDLNDRWRVRLLSAAGS